LSVIGVTSLLDDVFIESVGIFNNFFYGRAYSTGQILSYLRSRTLTQLRAFAVFLFYATSWRAPRSSQEGRPDVPSGASLSVPLFKEQQEKDINVYSASFAT